MVSNNKLTGIVLTYNEEIHIERCIRSLKQICSEVFIVDSFSTDNTRQLAESLGAKFIQHKWENNHARQFNWALDNLKINTEWIIRLDADEYLTDMLIKEINDKLESIPNDVSAVTFKRQIHFLGRWIKHGGCYPTHVLRMWRFGTGKFEDRWMDEHVKIENGKTISFENDFIDDNKNSLTWWTDKHNNYSTREAVDMLNIEFKFATIQGIKPELLSTQDKRKRWLKEKLYSKIPLFIRPLSYFLYRYFIKLGFLDGKYGLIWNFLQAFWYRFLVDAKIYDIKSRAEQTETPVTQVIKEIYKINI